MKIDLEKEILLMSANEITLSFLPLEILDRIATVDILTYRSMLSIPSYSRSTLGRKFDILSLFNFEIVRNKGDYNWIIKMERSSFYEYSPRRICYGERKSGNIAWLLLEEKSGKYKIHRESGPALITPSGEKVWFNLGRRHGYVWKQRKSKCDY